MQAIAVGFVFYVSFLMQNAVVANQDTEQRFAAMERRMQALEADNVLLRRELHAMKSKEMKHRHRFDFDRTVFWYMHVSWVSQLY